MSAKTKNLAGELADALPKDHGFKLYHICSPPTQCEPIYAPVPGHKPVRTFVEQHLINVSIETDAGHVFIFAIECYVYSTKYLTTIFVCKADSSGYAHLLNLPKEHPSPLRTIATTFIAWLIKTRLRKGVKLAVDLFARASDQYLYPGSVENPKKHVSSDRQLVAWWARVLHPILMSYAPVPTYERRGCPVPRDIITSKDPTAQAYLLVPGEDQILPFLPPEVRRNPFQRERWYSSHPLYDLQSRVVDKEIGKVPPRVLIPRFPDDPKHRFANELDEELPDPQSLRSQAVGQGLNRKISAVTDSPSKRRASDWKSVRSLEQFWEMMAFRSECSSGRMVGFFWLLVETSPRVQLDKEAENKSRIPNTNTKEKKKQVVLSGPIKVRVPRILAAHSYPEESPDLESRYYRWHGDLATEGQLLVNSREYPKAVSVLTHLDFATLDMAVQSTQKWIKEVGVLAGGLQDDWGVCVTGQVVPPRTEMNPTVRAMLERGPPWVSVSIQDWRRREEEEKKAAAEKDEVMKCRRVNVLGAGAVRKKSKRSTEEVVVEDEQASKKAKVAQPDVVVENGQGTKTAKRVAPEAVDDGAEQAAKKPRRVQPLRIG